MKNARAYRTLVRSLVGFSVWFFVGSMSALAFLYLPSQVDAYARMVTASAAAAVLLGGWLVLNIGLVPAAGAASSARFGVANYLTVARFLLITPVIVLLVQERFLAALAVYVLLGATDIVDGVVARRRREQSEFGIVMDPLADIFSTAAVFATFYALDIIPWWLLALLVLRYAMLIVGSFVLFVATGPIRFRATIPGKIVGLLQGAGAVVLVLAVASEADWWEALEHKVFVALAVCFGAIIVSQLVLGWRHLKRVSEGRAVGVGSEG